MMEKLPPEWPGNDQWWTISQHQEAAEGTRFAAIIETDPKLCICGEVGPAQNGEDPQTRKFRT